MKRTPPPLVVRVEYEQEFAPTDGEASTIAAMVRSNLPGGRPSTPVVIVTPAFVSTHADGIQSITSRKTHRRRVVRDAIAAELADGGPVEDEHDAADAVVAMLTARGWLS